MTVKRITNETLTIEKFWGSINEKHKTDLKNQHYPPSLYSMIRISYNRRMYNGKLFTSKRQEVDKKISR